MDLPVYVSHKKVSALEIKRIYPDHDGKCMEFIEPGYLDRRISPDMLLRYHPVPGDFFVVYEDGYQSFSPRKAFLEGYTKETT